jgi:SAM-dependent MidA family methyltransferase
MTGESDTRRDTPLARRLKERIEREGPLSVPDYMEACLHDPEHGYYRGKAAIGAAGDFTTAPEISQVFGELIGLWCVVVWQQIGAPDRVNLVELGPGRATLMRDALRAWRVVPGFLEALSLHLIETSNRLRAIQRHTLSGAECPVAWHAALSVLTEPSAIPDGPAIVVANEFLDALPVEQLVFLGGRWRRRLVGLHAGGDLSFEPAPLPTASPRGLPPDMHPAEGDVFEAGIGAEALGRSLLGVRAKRGPLAALFIDYGHERAGLGDSLQAVCAHRIVSPFHAPGETDLSHQVDFAGFARSCRESEEAAGGLEVDGPVTQAEFLGRLGIVERASRLMAANPGKAAEIETGVARLLAPGGMGTRYKAIGIRSRGLPLLPGFG